MSEPTRTGESAATRRVLVGLDYETEQPWVWLPDDPDQQAEGYSGQYAADIPAALIEEWEAIGLRQDALLLAIHAEAKFDAAALRIGDAPCGSYKGEPVTLPRGVIYEDCDTCGWSYREHEDGGS